MDFLPLKSEKRKTLIRFLSKLDIFELRKYTYYLPRELASLLIYIIQCTYDALYHENISYNDFCEELDNNITNLMSNTNIKILYSTMIKIKTKENPNIILHYNTRVIMPDGQTSVIDSQDLHSPFV